MRSPSISIDWPDSVRPERTSIRRPALITTTIFSAAKAGHRLTARSARCVFLTSSPSERNPQRALHHAGLPICGGDLAELAVELARRSRRRERGAGIHALETGVIEGVIHLP